MGSINVNGSFSLLLYEDENPSTSNIHAWEMAVWAKITAKGGMCRFFYSRTMSNGGDGDYTGFAADSNVGWTGIRVGQFGGVELGNLPVDGPGAVPIESDETSVWVRYIVYCEGAVDPGTDWSGEIKCAWIVDGDPNVYHVEGSRLASDCRLAGQWVPELVLSVDGNSSVDFVITSLAVWNRSLTDTERLNQANTRNNLFPSDVLRFEPLDAVANLPTSSMESGLEWSGSPLDSEDEPLFPADNGGEETFTAEITNISPIREDNINGHFVFSTEIFETSPLRKNDIQAFFEINIGEPLTNAKWLISGHSLTYDISPYVDFLVEDANLTSDWEQHIINGSLIKARTKGAGEHPGTPPWNGYSTGENRNENNLDLISHFREPPSPPYTHLIIAERHDLLGPMQWEGTVKYLRHYYELIREGSPNCIGYFYSTWLDYDLENLTEWIAYSKANDIAHAAVCSRINASLELEGRTDKLMLLPASGALGELVERATTGTVDGITQGSVEATLNVIFSDTVHLTDVGKYFISCVVYATVYRRDPRGLDYPEEITSTQAESLQEIAWDVVFDTFGNRPLGPQFDALDAQQEIVDFIPIYNEIYPVNVGNLQSYFGGIESDMYFDSDNDDIWFAPPASESFVGEINEQSPNRLGNIESNFIFSLQISENSIIREDNIQLYPVFSSNISESSSLRISNIESNFIFTCNVDGQSANRSNDIALYPVFSSNISESSSLRISNIESNFIFSLQISENSIIREDNIQLYPVFSSDISESSSLRISNIESFFIFTCNVDGQSANRSNDIALYPVFSSNIKELSTNRSDTLFTNFIFNGSINEISPQRYDSINTFFIVNSFSGVINSFSTNRDDNGYLYPIFRSEIFENSSNRIHSSNLNVIFSSILNEDSSIRYDEIVGEFIDTRFVAEIYENRKNSISNINLNVIWSAVLNETSAVRLNDMTAAFSDLGININYKYILKPIYANPPFRGVKKVKHNG